jgi:hypothetical protein
MLDSRRARGIAATLAVGVAAAVGAAVVTHGGATTNAAAASRSGAPPGAMGEGGRPSGAVPGRGGVFDADLTAAAAYLGISKSTLQADLKSGKTLAQVAAATPGKTKTELVAAIVAAEQKHTQNEGPTSSVAALTKRVEAMVAGERPKGPGPGAGGGGPPGA